MATSLVVQRLHADPGGGRSLRLPGRPAGIPPTSSAFATQRCPTGNVGDGTLRDAFVCSSAGPHLATNDRRVRPLLIAS